jgi:hypothetical protein
MRFIFSKMSFLIAGSFVVTTGCGPTLIEKMNFTPKLVRDIRFDDSCDLQPYFNSNPPALHPVTELIISSNKKKGAMLGKATYLIKPGMQSKMFFILLENFYQRLPDMDRLKPVRMTVKFASSEKSGGRRHVPIGAAFEMENEDHESTLPYHPCLAAFVYGRYYYAMRGRLLQQQKMANAE